VPETPPQSGIPCRIRPPIGSCHTDAVDLDTFRWLLTDDGQRLLARAAEAPEDPLRAQTALRRSRA